MSVTEPEPRSIVAHDPPAGPSVARRRGPSAVHELCPYLRAERGSWRSAYAAREHRCGAASPAAPIAVAKQRSLCLTPAHETCAAYATARAAVADLRGAAPADAREGLWPDVHPAPVLLEPTRGLLAPLARPSTRTSSQVLLAALMIVAVFVVVLARTTTPASAPEPSAPPLASLTAVVPSASPGGPGGSLEPAASPTWSPIPTPTPNASPSPAGSPAPTPVPSDARRYTVKPGDTLIGIAAKYGTTVKAITAANGITDPRRIRPGQVLVIP